MKLAVLTVIYPFAIPYFRDYLESMNAQDDCPFDIYLINDGVENLEPLLAGSKRKVNIHKGSGTPSQLRALGINWVCKNKYDAIIFTDSDDKVRSDRIRVLEGLLRKHKIVMNELELFGDNTSGKMFGAKYANGASITADDILCSNVLGFSNTAVRCECLRASAVKIPSNVIAGDWYLFSQLLAGGEEAFFTSETVTFYRQHDKTLAHLNPKDEQIIIGVNVKAQHYKALRGLTSKHAAYSNEFAHLKHELESSPAFKSAYITAVQNQIIKYPVWWEAIKTKAELKL